MMVIAIGLSSYNIALFHLVNHAFYKGLLFLGAGAVIHAVSDNQDFRKYGGLKSLLPLTYSVMLIASLSLVAFPFMSGFYSKDFILESAYGQFCFSGTVVYFIATMGAMFTTLYSVKVLYLTFITNPNGPLINYKQAHEGDIYMSLPLTILAFFSIFFGYITKDIFIGLGSDFFSDNSLFIHPLHETILDTEFAVPHVFKLLPLFLTIILSATSLVLSEFSPKLLIYFKLTRLGYNIFSFFNQRFLVELFYNKYITNLIFKLGGQTSKVLDKGSIEYIGPHGLEKGLLNLSKNLSNLDTGVITSYALYILIGLIFYILIPYILLSDNNLFLLIIFALLSIDEVRYSISSKSAIVNDYLQLHLHNSLSLCVYVCLSAKDLLFYKGIFGACFFGLGLVLPFTPLVTDVAPLVTDIAPLPAEATDIVIYSMVEDQHNPVTLVELREVYAEINRLLPQLSTFITQFHNFVRDNSINVVMDSEGSLGIDVLNSLPDATAQNYATRISVFDNLIHDRIHTLEELIDRARDLEAQAVGPDNSFISQLTQFTSRLAQLKRTYGHIAS